MNSESTLLSALHADPGDETTWLALADALEEGGQDDRAELARLWLALRQGEGLEAQPRRDREARLEGLLLRGVTPCVPALTNALGMALVLVPAGAFWMGSPESEVGRSSDEGPRRRVRLSRPFYIGVYPVTQEQYHLLAGENPSHFGPVDRSVGPSGVHPVEMVSWQEAASFCATLSGLAGERAAGRVYRLPTEAEWEYACRAAGTSTAPFHLGPAVTSKLANFDGHYPYGTAQRGAYLLRTTPVGSYPPNALGLFDMHGNVWEWCADWYHADSYTRGPDCDPAGPLSGTRRVRRGGSWYNTSACCRSAYRSVAHPDEPSAQLGFRVVMTRP